MWQILTTAPRAEFAVAGHLVGHGVTVYCPTLQIIKRQGPSAKRVRVDMPMFPGYLFVMASDATAKAVRSAAGFRGYLAGPEGPKSISEAAIDAVRQFEKELRINVCSSKNAYNFRVGDVVRISNAPKYHTFKDLEATVQRLDKQDRLTLCLILHGRSWQIDSPARWLELVTQSA